MTSFGRLAGVFAGLSGLKTIFGLTVEPAEMPESPYPRHRLNPTKRPDYSDTVQEKRKTGWERDYGKKSFLR